MYKNHIYEFEATYGIRTTEHSILEKPMEQVCFSLLMCSFQQGPWKLTVPVHFWVLSPQRRANMWLILGHSILNASLDEHGLGPIPPTGVDSSRGRFPEQLRELCALPCREPQSTVGEGKGPLITCLVIAEGPQQGSCVSKAAGTS